MKSIKLLCLIIFPWISLLGQRTETVLYNKLDEKSIKNWPGLGTNPEISNDGRYFMYVINNVPIGNSSLVVEGIENNWRKSWVGISTTRKSHFTPNSNQVVVLSKDTLYFHTLGDSTNRYVTNVASFSTPELKTSNWLAYTLKSASKDLIVVNLVSNKQYSYKRVNHYSFSPSGDVLLIQDEKSTLKWVDLKNDHEKTIYAGQGEVKTAVFDKDSKQLAIIVQSKSSLYLNNEVWYYTERRDSAEMLANNKSTGIDSGLFIQQSLEFSSNGRFLFIDLKANDLRKPTVDGVKLSVWNYKDSYNQAFQIKSPGRTNVNRSFSAVIPLNGKQKEGDVLRITYLNERIKAKVNIPTTDQVDWVLVQNDSIEIGDRFWLAKPSIFQYFLVSLTDGKRIKLPVTGDDILMSFSPGGKYLIYQDRNQNNHIFSYNVQTGRTANISDVKESKQILSFNEFEIKDEQPQPASANIACWVNDGKSVLMYGNYDVWLFDLNGAKSPVNITHGIGEREHIKFRFLESEDELFQPNSTLIVSAFNRISKFNGFYKVSVSGKNTPEMLTMGPYNYYIHGTQVPHYNPFYIPLSPVKAFYSNIWIVKRDNVDEAPNLFLTKDFKTYKQLTQINPQKDINWPVAELINFKQSNGGSSQGILYKPKNFDPLKKYPLLINYYEQFSHRLFQFPRPDFTNNAHINIPWFVSREYLVFTPDIYFFNGENGPSALSCLDGAFDYLSKLKFIDEKRVGIAGHSFAGGLTNYIITHSEKFKAAFVGAGTSDLISRSLQINDYSDGSPMMKTYEISLGGNIWEKPQQYLALSPVMFANKVNTPALFFQCRKDNAMDWRQGLEMFLALRRLNKKAWLLEYDDGGHGLLGKDAIDLANRVTQFFDHYLKNERPPVWMTIGIPASLKGIEDGLMLDATGEQP